MTLYCHALLRRALHAFSIPLILIALAVPTSAAPLITVPMAFAVDHTGAATLNIPISVPPGTNGMVPLISLSYNSSHANGPEGVGWTLSGFPAITRCPKTIATNGIAAPVTLANGAGGDVFCFIGEPLIQEQQQSEVGQSAPQGQQFSPGGQLIGLSGTYGADQTVYTTEIEQFSRIVSYSKSGYSGPSSFLVYTRDGLMYEFGATTDSNVICGTNSNCTLTWMLDKVTDTFGNYVTVTYIQNGGHAYPNEVDYTGNSGLQNAGHTLSPQNKIVFGYTQGRSDAPFQYLAGIQSQTAWLLSTIQTEATQGSLQNVTLYTLGYGAGLTGRNRLNSITVTTPGGSSLLPATFGYCDTQCSAPADLMTSFNNGLAGNTTVAYQLTTHTSVYPTGFVSGLQYPTQSLVTPRYVVQTVSAPNVVGANYSPASYTTTYQYFNGETNLVGRGFLGFGEVCTTDQQTDLQKCTFYNQAYPNIGNVNEVKVTSQYNNVVVQDTVTQYGAFSPYDGRPAANTSYVTSVVTTGHDLAGNPMPTTTKTYASPDGYGNVTTVTTDVHSVIASGLTTDYLTTASYTWGNNLAGWQVVPFGSAPINWLIGRLEQSNVSATYTDNRSGQTSYNSTIGPRVTSYLPSNTNASVTQKTIQPTGTNIPNESSGQGYTQVTQYAYDYYGNRKKEVVSAPNDTSPVTLPSRTTNSQWGSSADPNAEFAEIITNPLGQSETRVFNLLFGVPSSVTDINNQTTLYTYDAFGRLVTKKPSDGSTITTSYLGCPNTAAAPVLPNASGCPSGAQYAIQVTDIGSQGDAMSPETVTYYDALDRVIDSDTEAFNGSMSRVTKTYNNQLQVASVTRPYYIGATQYLTTYAYDALNRVTQSNYPDGSYDQWLYYETYKTVIAGITSNFPGEQTDKIYDGAGNLLITVQYPTPGQTTGGIWTNFAYDGFSNLNFVTDNAGNLTRNYYDVLSRKIGYNDPDAGNELKSYSAFGDLSVSGNGFDSFNYNQYDKLSRLTWRCWTNNNTTADQYTCANANSNNEVLEQWGYDPANGIGELGSESSTQGTSSSAAHTYNSLGQPLTSTFMVGTGTTAQSFAYAYYYDPDHRPSYYQSPSGVCPQTTYAASSYVSGLIHQNSCDPQQSLNPMWTVTSRDAEMHLTGVTYGSNAPVNGAYSYDPTTGRETGETMTPAGSQTPLENMVYQWDQLGNLNMRNDTVHNLQEAYCYDGLNRLLSTELASACAFGPPIEVGFAYDSAGLGNMTTKSDVGTYTYPQAGQPQPHGVQTITPAAGGANLTFAYDAVGKMTTDPLSQNSFGYLPYQMPVSIQHTGGDTMTVQYDADHHRVMRTVLPSNTMTYYLPDGLAVSVAGGAFKYYTYFMGGGERVAADTGKVGSLKSQYYLNDYQNSIGLVVNDSAVVVEAVGYDTFGKPRNMNGTADPTCAASANAKFGYINQENLPDLCLIDLNARYYDPALARFMAPDPIVGDASDSQAWNAYTYSRNNPMSKDDPTGLDANTTMPDTDNHDPFETTMKVSGGGGQLMAKGPDGRTYIISNSVGQQLMNAGATVSPPAQSTIVAASEAAAMAPVKAEALPPLKQANYLFSGGGGGSGGPTLQQGTGGTAFVGGFFDYWTGGPAYTEYEAYIATPGANAAYFTWDQGGALGSWIDANGGAVSVIGHSYGGDTAASVVAAGHSVASLTTVDPVSWFRPSYAAVAAHAGFWTDFNATGGGGSIPNIIAGVGGAWNSAPASFANRFQNIPLDHAGVMYRCGLPGSC